MEEEIIETEVEETPTEPEAPDPAAELAAREEAIAKRDKELNKGFDKLAREKRELEAKLADASAPEEELPELPEETRKVLKKMFDEEYGAKLKAVDNLYSDMVDTELSKRENPDAIKEIISEYGFMPKDDTIASVREVFDKAEAIAKSKSVNPEALREQIRTEEREAILKELAAEGVQVETIEPKRSEQTPDWSLDDDDVPSDVKVRMLKEKWGDLK